jgi:hopanoid-associated phosphorylase
VTAAGAVIVACGLPFEAALVAGEGIVVACGPGPRRVAQGIAALVAGAPAGTFAGIISFGCAGGLDPALASGACIVPDAVLTDHGECATDAAWTRALRARLPQARAGLLRGIDAPLASAADKARLWRDCGAGAVDMESHAAALAARRHGLPFAACRVVLDPAWRGLPGCALAALREDGGTDVAALLRALATAPGELGPLAALALDAWRARRALRRVRAQLGEALAPPR